MYKTKNIYFRFGFSVLFAVYLSQSYLPTSKTKNYFEIIISKLIIKFYSLSLVMLFVASRVCVYVCRMSSVNMHSNDKPNLYRK